MIKFAHTLCTLPMVAAACLVCLSSCTSESNRAGAVARDYALSFCSMDMNGAAALCTEDGQEALKWYASNITQQDLDFINGHQLTVTTQSVALEGDSCAVAEVKVEGGYMPQQLGVGELTKDTTLTIHLVKRQGEWKVRL